MASLISSTAQARSFIVSNNSQSSQTFLVVNGTTGYTGIGTGNPLYPLDIVGNVRWSGSLMGGNVSWSNLVTFPSACPAGYAVKSLNNTDLTCISVGTGTVNGSGTPNYIPYWMTATEMGDSIIYQSGGKIGINTAGAVPIKMLDVVGDINATAGVYGASIYQNGKSVLDNTTSFSGNVTGAYNTLNLASNSVDSAKIFDGSIVAADIANGAINSSKLVADLGLGWANLTAYPSACPAGQAIQGLADGSFTCVALNSTSGNISGAGTPNYVSKFITAGTIGNSIMYDDGSKVGIGTSSPIKTFDVVGDINATGALYSANGLVVSGGTVTLPNGEVGNVELANSSITITAGNGLTDGGAVSLGSSATLNIGAGEGITVNPNNVSIDTAIVPQKGVDETITGNWVFQNNLMVGGKISYVNSETLNLNGSIIPPLDNWFNIGNSTNRWKNVSAVSLYQGGNPVLDRSTAFGGNVSGNYSSIQLASNSVGTGQIIDGAITTSKIAPDLNLGWANLTDYPADCGVGMVVKGLADGSLTCTAAGTGNISGGGNTNVIAKFTGAGTIGNSTIFESGGNVGINTTTPQNTLNVIGTLNVTTGSSVLTLDSNGDLTFGI